MLAVLAPGQGSQRQGFLAPWLELDGAAEQVETYSELIGIDLRRAGTVMSDIDITDTAVAQPLIVAASLLTASALARLPADTTYAGHSVGEFAAAVLAGVLSESEALSLVARRGAAMAAASAAPPGGMTAVLGGEPATVDAAIREAGAVVANHNARGQVVAAGTRAALEALAATPPPRARLRPLAVAGAFHSPLMAPARAAMADAARDLRPADPTRRLLSNADGGAVATGAEFLFRLIAQVCEPVRWDRCLQTLDRLGITAVIELAPAGTLTALVRRELPHVQTVTLEGPDDLAAARTLLDESAAELGGDHHGWRLLVAPASGTARLLDRHETVDLAAGDLVATVATHNAEHEVHAGHDGTLLELLVKDGDPVSAGQPLARIAQAAQA